MTRHLSMPRLQAYLKDTELPARSVLWPVEEAQKIIRYGSFVGSLVEHHRTLDRAMIHARAHIEGCERSNVSVTSGTVILADRLTGSKGRFTRTWYAPQGGLWGCMIYISTLLPRYRILVPLAVGIACCEAVREQGAEQAVIRWINDVLIDSRKVGGFLAENFTGHRSREDYCLLGFGININNSRFPDELDQIATSLKNRLGREVDIEQFTYCFLAKLCWNLGLLYYREQRELEAGNSDSADKHPLVARWLELSDSVGRPVVFGFDVRENPQYRATVTGITNDGGLLLKLDDGAEVVEHSGEIRYVKG
ncbi:MAG: biotin--[acetyl-CoA-carboxylase] ligase [Desulfofustis sp.]|nr:biotin--[acetyl-CoA-carboxylase] ligase [Desulfofustis sp.]